MKYTFTSENLHNMLFEYTMWFTPNKKPSSDSMIINKLEFGKVSLNTKHIQGINLIEWEAVFSKQTTIHENMDNGGSLFALYFNLGKHIDSKLLNKEMPIFSKSQNIWSFSGTENGSVNYKQGEKSHTFSIVLEENYFKNLVDHYPDLLTDLYTGHCNNSFWRWNKCDIPINNEITQILSQIQNADIMGKYSSLYIEAKVLELLILQLHCPDKHNCCLGKFCKSVSDIDKMHEARNILLQNIEKPPSIYELSKKVGVNDHKLKNGFKEVFNQTIYGCLFEYKMERAYKLLLETDKTIFEIGCECGYDYPSHFTTAFKRRFGVSPKEFRGNLIISC